MSISKPKMRPIHLKDSAKTGVRTQFGALCYRVRDEKPQVLLVTSRGTGRWILPKGWPIDGASPSEAAMQEAWEEAGVEGKVMSNSLGIYSYVKEDDGERMPCVVAVFPVKVQKLKKKFPEVDQRSRKWFSLKKAAALVDEPELRQIMRGFDPDLFAR